MNDCNDGSVLLSVPESHSIGPAGMEMAHLNAIQLFFLMLLITSCATRPYQNVCNERGLLVYGVK